MVPSHTRAGGPATWESHLKAILLVLTGSRVHEVLESGVGGYDRHLTVSAHPKTPEPRGLSLTRRSLLVFPAGIARIGTTFCQPPEICTLDYAHQNNGTPLNLDPRVFEGGAGLTDMKIDSPISPLWVQLYSYIFDHTPRILLTFFSPLHHPQACRCIVSRPTTLCVPTAPSTPQIGSRPLPLTQSRHIHPVQSPSYPSRNKSAPTISSSPIYLSHLRRARVPARYLVEGVARIRLHWIVSSEMITRTRTSRSLSHNSTYFTP